MKPPSSTNARLPIIRLAKGLWFAFALLVGALVVLKSLAYASPDFSQGFLLGKAAIFPWYRVFLWMHIAGAPLALGTGLLQFSLPRRGRLHRISGYGYVGAILALGAPGGLGMAFHAIGGWPSVLNFLVLTPLWIWFTVSALQAARRRDFPAHQRWMVRSFLLTNSAVVLRLLSFITNHYLPHLDPVTCYTANVWLSWLPALGVYEIWRMGRR